MSTGKSKMRLESAIKANIFTWQTTMAMATGHTTETNCRLRRARGNKKYNDNRQPTNQHTFTSPNVCINRFVN